ncbi:Eukaryotic initiation factor 4E family protein [Trichomonas vaginalis G3]|uniref:Eukaryotic initiation factor 4E family protein n=1 Tax=Trichomonas vaginalis (strain ATCC PRA-98 / G3) TaxID=412133 RepID=A2G6I4_TRIV3|nr:translation initiation factor protein [Trichomonas vaginalis G3]XP_051112383.1 translation initiation factor protein [Trichomonas vaginalis G3]EAX87234.1 Eukaryotic initiation factor 4E family protein [Trichomonas vaginalis G3]KAI5511272.1 translation initiation factor protein [Trichomonas vaginalis G3]KAI5552755.1 translation initiation factor protein [Trichomonas vaginalis G3]|eukprot:XP_001300164.1 Eukaryotic initiation factor 4E family protein [Trichomonas vaginalis G3]
MTEEHPLQNTWTFYYYERPASAEDYLKSIHSIGSFNTCEKFWSFYSHMVRPDKLKTDMALQMFKEGYKAIWEDEAIKNGGQITIRLQKKLFPFVWEKLVLNMIGEQISQSIIGVVASSKQRGDSIELWIDFKSQDPTEKEAEKLDMIRTLIEKLNIAGKLRFKYTDFSQFKSENPATQKKSEFYMLDNGVVKRTEYISLKKPQTTPESQ